MIRFWEGRLIIAAADSDRAAMRMPDDLLPFGDVVSLAAKAGDSLYVVRTATGHIGLSLLRDKTFILAIGAVTSVPLGNRRSATAVHRELQDGIQPKVAAIYVLSE